MIETNIKKITSLDPKDGLAYAQWGMMRVTTESDCSYFKWQQERNKEHEVGSQKSWLEKPTEGQQLGPFGLVDRKE